MEDRKPKKIIVTKSQLLEHIERKKADKVFYDIILDIRENVKNINESVFLENANQAIIDNYKRKNLISPRVLEQLVKNCVISENYGIL
jgi:hypothetical protein